MDGEEVARVFHLVDELQLVLEADANPDGKVEALRQFAAEMAIIKADGLGLIARGILDEQPVAVGEEPDGALSTWLVAAGGARFALLSEFLSAGDLNDAQKERLATFSLYNKEMMGLPFFVEILPRLLPEAASPATASLLARNLEQVASLATTAPKKSTLAASLTASVAKVSGENLRYVAQTIEALGGRGQLEKREDVVRTLDKDQLTVLSGVFAGSTVIRDALGHFKDE